jgi:hypothetical protein
MSNPYYNPNFKRVWGTANIPLWDKFLLLFRPKMVSFDGDFAVFCKVMRVKVFIIGAETTKRPK